MDRMQILFKALKRCCIQVDAIEQIVLLMLSAMRLYIFVCSLYKVQHFSILHFRLLICLVVHFIWSRVRRKTQKFLAQGPYVLRNLINFFLELRLNAIPNFNENHSSIRSFSIVQPTDRQTTRVTALPLSRRYGQ